MSITCNFLPKEQMVLIGHLLPSIQQIEPNKAIALSLIITKLTHAALLALKEGRLSEFDAPVGDNSCKIRAAKIADLAERKCSDLNFARAIEKGLKQSLRILNKIKEIKIEKPEKNLSLLAFRYQHGIEFSICPDLSFLIQAHFLFKVKKTGTYDKTDPSILQKISSIATSVAKNWIHKMKEWLAISSVQFLQNEVQLIKPERQQALKRMLDSPFIKFYEGRPVLPNLPCMEVIFTRALEKERFIILKIEEDVDNNENICKRNMKLLFHPNSAKTQFQITLIDKEDLEKAAIVIESKRLSKKDHLHAFEKIEKDIIQENFLHLLLATASQDPQYLNGNRSEQIPFESCFEDALIQEEKTKFEELNQIAHQKGVSTTNPRLFVITHIFADLIKNQVESHIPKLPEENRVLSKSQRIFEDINRNRRVNWMGDDLNIPPGSWDIKINLYEREVYY